MAFKNEFVFVHFAFENKTANRNTMSNKYFGLIGQFWSTTTKIILESFMTVRPANSSISVAIATLPIITISNTYFVLIGQFWSTATKIILESFVTVRPANSSIPVAIATLPIINHP